MKPKSTPIVGGAVTALQIPVALDGRVAAYPSSLRGQTTVNLYLLRDGDAALLIDTGFSAHQDLIMQWLEDELPRGHRLGVVTLRQSEFDSVCNVVPTVNRFNVTMVFGAQSQGMTWFGFRPDQRLDESAAGTGYSVLKKDPITFLDNPSRAISAIVPALRLLNTHWLFDPLSRTLFTSDAFCHLDGESVHEVTVDELIEYLIATRYWWLAGARTSEIVDWLDQVFTCFPVERIAPAYGPVLEGVETVARTVDIYKSALRQLADAPSAAARMGRIPA
ncbi:hypothetical protein M1247_16210 [Mycobacterium sp. 21AC1]|uniref:hypothetical protein n=1 Tax=[Mycobacterium] appelbergii TaxID=2939269 RepID=UPI002939474A|nr:hypothetical protein [Mycobacterium sp. 21AC1]MDV3126467.1 hypothetical protein [Mycobacterium sp. 21AC1]